MSELFSVAQVVDLMGWRCADQQKYQRQYQRAYTAVCLGFAGRVRRIGRGFVLSEKNVKKLMVYLRQRWPEPVEAQL